MLQKTNVVPANESLKTTLRQNLRREWRLYRWLFAALLLALVGVAGYYAVAHWQTVHRVTAATAEMDAQHPGWRLPDLEAARATVPDDENGALVVTAAAKLLPKDWPPQEIEFSKQFADWPPNKRLTSDQQKRLREALEPLKPAIAEARKLTTRSTGRYPMVYERDPRATQYPHIADMQAVTELLTLAALLRMEDGDLSEAAKLCQAALNAGRSVGDEPLMIPQMVRLVCIQMASKTVERLLDQGECDCDDLETLQRTLEEEVQYPSLLALCRGERAILHSTLQAVEDGDLTTGVEPGKTPTWTERYQAFSRRDSLRQEHVALFPIMNKLVEIAERPAAERAQPLREFRSQLELRPKDLASMPIAGLGGCAESFVRRDAYLTCLAAALAAERYRRSHKDWPMTVAALTPEFLKIAPRDPADGLPLNYRRLKDGAVGYSIGPDAHGRFFNPDQTPPLKAEGIAVRLWNPELRGKDN